MSDLSVHFSSAKPDWATPWWLIRKCEARWGRFELDVCGTHENAKAPCAWTPEQDGLKQPWRGMCWCNPPYGREIGKWVARAAQQSADEGAQVVALLPARTDTAWWHDYVALASFIGFLRGKVRFEGAPASAPFPSAIVLWLPWLSDMRPFVEHLDWRAAQ